MKFQLKSDFKPTGDQPQAIDKLTEGTKQNLKHQVLLGVTGSGKTFTIANVIENVQKPTLIISHNKTLAAQLYQEFRDFFPKNAVSYFVSYYDYYQPEAYIPQTDTYIQKETDINEKIDRLRLQATTNLFSKKDSIVVASVSCIYNIGSPQEYKGFILELKPGQNWERKKLFKKLVRLQFTRSDYYLQRGAFRVHGERIDILPAHKEKKALRVILKNSKIDSLKIINSLTGKILDKNLASYYLYPTKHYMTGNLDQKNIFRQIRQDLKKEVSDLKKEGKKFEAHRLETRVNYDLEQIAEFGYVNGIENYSRYFDGRQPGEPPYTLIDYFPNDFLLVIDESHITVPQIRGMYEGDRSRKEILISHGFRLKAARDNRPLNFSEFARKINQALYTSATPAIWEIEKANQAAAKNKKAPHHGVVEQLIRPTGVVDPEIIIRPIKGQIDDLITEIEKRVKKKERTLVTTLTMRMAEDLSHYLKQRKIKVHYLHSRIDTLDRVDILENLRRGKYDVVVGVNLLREGLDLPEVSLVAILDADKEGFLRSETSLIQVMGRAARHIRGKVIMYAEQVTGSMQRAVDEVNRRRQIQARYNQKHNIKPKSIKKPIRKKLLKREKKKPKKDKLYGLLDNLDPNQLIPMERKKIIKQLKRQMTEAAAGLEFELAAEIRDKIREIEKFRILKS